jgi:hypothetical protein
MAVDEETPLSRARAIKAKYETELLRKENVVGVGVGYRRRGGELTDEIAIIVQVRRKVPWRELSSQNLVPEMLDDVPVDVEVIGPSRAW